MFYLNIQQMPGKCIQNLEKRYMVDYMSIKLFLFSTAVKGYIYMWTLYIQFGEQCLQSSFYSKGLEFSDVFILGNFTLVYVK